MAARNTWVYQVIEVNRTSHDDGSLHNNTSITTKTVLATFLDEAKAREKHREEVWAGKTVEFAIYRLTE
jgi:hypothetical protein